MKLIQKLPPSGPVLQRAVLVLIALAASLAPAATIWTGPPITFTKTGGADPTLPANQDRITTNVWITRGSIQGIFNAKTESAYTHNVSPADTEWAYGTTADINLTYQPWETWYGGVSTLPGAIVGRNTVLHLKTDDIYIDIKFTSWGTGVGGGGAFSYQRSTAPTANLPPTVTIASPTNGAAFSSPANVSITANANDPDGSVTNVAFFDGGTFLGRTNNTPYSVPASLAPGGHTLTAVATDNLGLSATSTVVKVTVSSANIRLTYQVSGNLLDISWPVAGGRLETQANSPGVGIGGTWVTVPGSTTTNRVVVVIDPAGGSVFYRLALP